MEAVYREGNSPPPPKCNKFMVSLATYKTDIKTNWSIPAMYWISTQSCNITVEYRLETDAYAVQLVYPNSEAVLCAASLFLVISYNGRKKWNVVAVWNIKQRQRTWTKLLILWAPTGKCEG